MTNAQKIKKFLECNADPVNASFQSRLIFTNDKIWGLKTPVIENFVKDFIKEGGSFEDFKLDSFEEVVMAGMFIGRSKASNEEKKVWLKVWLPHVDNWASCDMIVGRLKGMQSEVEFFKSLLTSAHVFTQRFGIIWLMRWNLKVELKDTLQLVMQVANKRDDKACTHSSCCEKNKLCKEKTNAGQCYYLQMAKAWTLAEAVLIDYDYTKNIISQIDDKFLRNKAISKACESYRVTQEQKQELKALRIK